ncbi:hypothetical protein [Aquimarina sp. I32.4]|uniref:hypothetical protein n=1 Tax=Aquimarina sp. I32.4 TaxID=2053903 RepID=UPI000CDF2BF8|nr:hypothetical protein [Aquimarina sp. I32.4]
MIEKRIASVKESILNNTSLTKSDREWLNKQKRFYAKKPESFSVIKLELLDSLNPYLGYNWKEGLNLKEQAQKKNVEDIYQAMKEGKPLSGRLIDWLNAKKNIYHKTPDKLDDKLIKLLDSLNPVLGRDWREPFRFREQHSNTMLLKLSSSLKSKRKPEKMVTKWLVRQGYSYRKNPDTLRKSIKDKLDALIPLLGYDWKLLRRNETISLEKKVAIIKRKLQKKRKLDKKEKRWLAHYRRKYHKDPYTYPQEHITVLNTLNAFLAIPWQEYATTKPKPNKHFKDWVNEIKEQKLPYHLLSVKQKDYLRKQRQRYLSNKKKYPPTQLIALNSLNEILERDWKKKVKKSKKPIPFHKQIKTIKVKLQSKTELSYNEKNLISRSRNLYHKDSVSPERIEQLNTLSSLLGYDWKDPSRLRKDTKTFKERIAVIKECLESNKELPSRQKKWLDYHRARYLKSPDNYPADKIFILDTLNPLLKRDWKVKIINVKEKISFKESIVKVRQQLIAKKELTEKQKAWLNLQRSYYKKNTHLMTESKIKSLDSLNILLKYDWKMYKHER